MQAYCIQTVVTQVGTMTLKNLPFRQGDDFQTFYHWMKELDHHTWDRQIEEDSKSGVLD